MRRLNILPEYQTSFIYAVQLDNIGFLEYSSPYQELNDNAKAQLVARQEQDGSWTLLSRLQWGDEAVVYEDVSFEKMVARMMTVEDILFAESKNHKISELELNVFMPEETLTIAEDDEIKTLQNYIRKHRLSDNHICHLACAIGQSKQIISNMMETLEKKHPQSQAIPSTRGWNGGKFYIN